MTEGRTRFTPLTDRERLLIAIAALQKIRWVAPWGSEQYRIAGDTLDEIGDGRGN